MRKATLYRLSDKEFIHLCENSENRKEVLGKLGLSSSGSSYEILNRRIADLGVKFKSRSKGVNNKEGTIYVKDPRDLFTASSLYSGGQIRRRVLRTKEVSYECACCGNPGIWQEGKLTLHLDHINGVRNDHRLENLRFLCPNCHSQTPTYAGRNIKNSKLVSNRCVECKALIGSKSKRCRSHSQEGRQCVIMKLSRDELKRLMFTSESMESIAKMAGVSSNALRKWCCKWGIDFRNRER